MQSRRRPFNRDAAFTRTELLFVACIVCLVIAIGILALTQARYNQQRRVCVNNLKNVGLAFRLFSASGDRFPFEVSTNDGGTIEYTNVWQHLIIFSNELSSPKILICPASRKPPATSWQSFKDQNNSYFVGLSAGETYPQSFLAGDAGLLINGQIPQSNPIHLSTNANISYPASVHRGLGTICTGDGFVQQLRPDRLKELLRISGLDTNVLLLPR